MGWIWSDRNFGGLWFNPLDEKQKREIRALLRDPTITVKDVAKRYGVSRTTLYKTVGVVNPDKVSK